jgi:DNA-binding winged helix-turn-helix (wHTH) protein
MRVENCCFLQFPSGLGGSMFRVQLRGGSGADAPWKNAFSTPNSFATSTGSSSQSNLRYLARPMAKDNRDLLEVLKPYVRFGPFQIDQQRQDVTRDGSRLKLQGKVYQTLLILLERSGEVVTRQELRSRLWPADTHVNFDANVNTTVNKLRQALGDSFDNPLYIQTIPKKGYCLLAQPEISDRPANSQSGQTETSKEAARESHGLLGVFKFSKSVHWIVLSALGLILAGMLLGAGIMRLWMNHAAGCRVPQVAVFYLWVLVFS